MTLMRQRNNRLNHVFALVLTIVAVAVGHITAQAVTVTYTISGSTEPNGNVNLTVTASGYSYTSSAEWNSSSTTKVENIELPGVIKLSFGIKSPSTGNMAVQNGVLQIEATSSSGGYITLEYNYGEGDSHKLNPWYVYHVTLKDNSGGVIHEGWSTSSSNTYNFQSIQLKTIVVEYAQEIPITGAVFSGLNESYPVSNAAVEPTPTVTWHGTTLTKDTHYTLSYSNKNSAGPATVTATGMSTTTKVAFTGSVSANYELFWANYTVRFNKNNESAEGTMTDQGFYYTEEKALTANTFTVPLGYHFDRWTTNADGSGDSYTDGQSVSNLSATNGAVVNLYGQWAANTYTVTLDNQDATTAGTTEVTATFDASMPAITVPERTGYTFGGYYTETNGGGTKYYNADGTSANTWDIASATTLYAQWTAITVTYIDEDGIEQSKTYPAYTIIQTGSGQKLGTSANNEAWYVVIGDVNTSGTLTFQDKGAHLIVCDGATLTASAAGMGISCYSLTIYGQSGGTGSIVAINTSNSTYAIRASGNVTINGGNVSATGGCGIDADGNVAINGGTVSATGNNSYYNGISAGGTITLGWRNASDRITASSYYPNPAVKSGQTLTDGTNTYSGTLSFDQRNAIAGQTLMGVDVLQDNAANDIAALNDKQTNIILQGRTLTKSGAWNTLCLPFDVNDGDTTDGISFTGTPLEESTVKELNATNSNLTDGALTLAFSEVNSIEAGKPYIVKWENTTGSVSNPVFTGVTIDADAPTEVTSTADGGKVKFVGQYNPFDIDNSNINSILFVGSGSQIGYSENPRILRSFRAHFWVQPNGDGSPAAQLIDVDWGEGSTGIREIEANGANGANRPYKTAWYTLDGRQLSGKPTAKGLYIHNGRKTVIK